MPGGAFLFDSVFTDSWLPTFIPPNITNNPSLPSDPRRRHRTEEGLGFGRLLHSIMPPPSNSGLDQVSDDDLVEIASSTISRPSSTVAPLVLPQSGNQTSSTGAARRRQHTFSRQPPVISRQDEAVIDLTEEPDSPVEVRAPAGTSSGDDPVWLPPIRTHRHPRRTNSQHLTPPRLSRSESILLASQTSFIDLTGDDDTTAANHASTNANINTNADTNADTETSRASGPNRHRHRHRHRNHQRPDLQPEPDYTVEHDHLVDFEFLNPRHATRYSFASTLARGFGRTLADILGAEFLHSSPRQSRPAAAAPPPPPPPPPPAHSSPPLYPYHRRHHHHHQHMFQPASPRREMPPLPPTRFGFTRDTCADPGEDGDERVVICPACNEELAYDPAGGATSQPGAPGGSKKRKRAVGDHHFWAVKKCGHVYCAECFENRRPTKAHPGGVGFAGPPGKMPNQAPHDLRCAVEGCESKVANKSEWIGIYL